MNDWVEFKDEYNKIICIRSSAVTWFEKTYAHPESLTTLYLTTAKTLVINDDYADVKTKLIKADSGKA